MRGLLRSSVLATSVALVATGGVAEAASVTVGDPRGDVHTVTIPAAGGSFTETTTAGARPDATSVRLSHSRRAVSLRLRFVDVERPTGSDSLVALVEVRGSNGQKRALRAGSTAARPDGSLSSMTKVGSDARVCTSGLRVRVDYRAETISITFPRRCIGSPAKVRATVIAALVPVTPAGQDTVYTYDDALRPDGDVRTAGETITRWVRRG